MTTSTLSIHGLLAKPSSGFLRHWQERRARRRQLRHLEELPDYLLRDIGLDHLTRSERRRRGS